MISARDKKSNKTIAFLLFKLTRRTILFLFLFLIAMTMLYIVGDYQMFLDSSQKIVLITAAFSAAALLIISFIGIIESIVCLFIQKHRRLYHTIHLLLILLAFITSILAMIFFRVINILSAGI